MPGSSIWPTTTTKVDASNVEMLLANVINIWNSFNSLSSSARGLPYTVGTGLCDWIAWVLGAKNMLHVSVVSAECIPYSCIFNIFRKMVGLDRAGDTAENGEELEELATGPHVNMSQAAAPRWHPPSTSSTASVAAKLVC